MPISSLAARAVHAAVMVSCLWFTGCAALPRTPLSVSADGQYAAVHERVTLRLNLDRKYDNPYDPEEVRVDAEVREPSGKTWTAPGFYYQPCLGSVVDGLDVVKPAGAPHWQVRLSFPKPGEYRVRVKATDKRGVRTAAPVTVHVGYRSAPGMIRRHSDDVRFLVAERGETFFAVGANISWGEMPGEGGTGVFAYDRWLPAYAKAGCNTFRVWLNPHWATFALNTAESGYNRIDQENAWRLDRVLNLAERLDMRALLAIDSFNIAREDPTHYGCFLESPYYVGNGGPLTKPKEYFTKPAMLKAYRHRLRYLIARWGYSPSVLAWEFWNEVDLVDDYDSRAITEWHRQMARHLRRIDPWRHLLTTSHARSGGDPFLDNLPELDLALTHSYNQRDMAEALGQQAQRKVAAWHRPHFHAEFGCNSGAGADTREQDPTGIHLHNALYASVGQLQAGAPLTWWWDLYVEPQNLYPVFAAFNGWLDGFDFLKQHARQMKTETSYIDDTTSRAFANKLLWPTQVSWGLEPQNRPTTVTLLQDGRTTSSGPLSGLLHGLGDNRVKHNPATFVIDAFVPTTFTVIVGDVSGHGGAELEISLDGEVVETWNFFDADDKRGTETLKLYAGTYSIPLPAGPHRVRVRNIGRDWMFVSYFIPRLFHPETPALRASGVVGDRRALLWVQNPQHTWSFVGSDFYENRAVTGAQLAINNLPPGRWRVERWDTEAGQVIETDVIQNYDERKLTLTLPPITWDAAYRLRKLD